MRRLTALFVPKRSSKSDAGSSIRSETPSNSHSSNADHASPAPGPNPDAPGPKPTKARSGFFRSLSRNGGQNSGVQSGSDAKARRHPMPSLTTDPSSSASSSSGGPHTPDDDRASLVPPAEPSRLPSWLNGSGSASMAPDDLRVSALDTTLKLHPMIPSVPQILRDDTDDESSSEGSSESELEPSRSSIPKSNQMSPLAYFKVLTVNGISPPFSPPPLLHIPGSPVYPRSSNSVSIVSPEQSLRTLMFKKRLLRQITGGPLSPSFTASLTPFGRRSRNPQTSRLPLKLDDNWPKDTKYLDTSSHGLQWWIDRSCFEERNVLYMPDAWTGDIQVLRITGSDLGVAALEFSEGLEAMAGLDYLSDSSPSTLPVSSPSVLSSGSSSVHSSPSMMPTQPPPSTIKAGQPSASSSPSRNSLYKAAPSPLRMEHTTESPLSIHANLPGSPIASASTPAIVLSPNSPETKPRPSSQPPVKHAVRFAEGDKKEDSVPAGYVMRIKQKREEKARFLQMERERRVHEEQRRKHEEERRRQEEEKSRWEKEKAAWDRERKAMEDERKKRQYVDELAAARSRRENSRVGAAPNTLGGSPILWDGDRELEKERRGREAMPTYLRPTYDNSPLPAGPRRGSDTNVPSAASRNGSPGSSRPPSVGGSGSASGSIRGSSRPPSIYSTPPSSATDIHSRERRESRASKRGSINSESSQWAGVPSSYPMPQGVWGMNPAMIPPVPPMPMIPVVPIMPYAVDMPLLPPTPPFMMQQFGPRKSPSSQQQRSHSSSPTIGVHRLPSSQSLEKVNQYGSSQPSSPNHRAHERRSSEDTKSQQRRMSHSPALTQSKPQSHPHPSHDRRNISSSSHKQPPAHSGISGSSSSRRMDTPSSNQGHHSSSPRPPSIPRTNTMPIPVPAQSSLPYVTPTPVLTASWTQPAFQNLSRPTSNRRQTMIS